MRKITSLKIEYSYANTSDSEARADRFYKWLINKAIDNLLEKQKAVDNNSTLKYIIINEKNTSEESNSITRKNSQLGSNWQRVSGQSQPKRTSRARISNPRGGSHNTKSQENYDL